MMTDLNSQTGADVKTFWFKYARKRHKNKPKSKTFIVRKSCMQGKNVADETDQNK